MIIPYEFLFRPSKLFFCPRKFLLHSKNQTNCLHRLEQACRNSWFVSDYELVAQFFLNSLHKTAVLPHFFLIMAKEDTHSNSLYELFAAPNTPLEVYPFDRISPEVFPPCMQLAIDLKRQEIETIASNPEPPTFANTIEALEKAGAPLEAICGAFYNLLHANASEPLMAQAQEYSPLLSRLSADVSLNPDLFARIRHLYEHRETLNLDSVQLRLLRQTYDGFVDRGALLEGEQQAEYRRVVEELSKRTTSFAQNKLQDEQRWHKTLPPSTPSLSGLPKSILNDAEQNAQKHNEEGYRFTLSMPHFSAIMRFCTDARVREEFYRARQSVGYADNENNNIETVRRIVDLRCRLAQLMGYESYAHYRLKDCMLSTPQQVIDLLDSLKDSYIEPTRDELKELQTYAGNPLHPWDLAFYMERYKEEHYQIKEEELRPYFPLQKVISGVFSIAERLYGVSFEERTDLPIYHPDVKTYSVLDGDKSLLGLLYLDFFPRSGKQSGAWMNNLREMSPNKRPQIVLVMNFTPPSEKTPALLTPSEVNTFLHEFGHALHGLLTQARYTSLSGTNVQHDFVELPSQFMENFLSQPQVVRELLSSHYQTEEPLPNDLLQKFLASERYPAGYQTMRQLFFGYLDMAYHHRTQPLPIDWEPRLFEQKACQHITIWEAAPQGCCTTTSFSHIFSGGYAAGYYGYKWSEVLDADAFSLFLEQGIWNTDTAHLFRSNILEKGDEEDPMILYQRFRGRKPSLEALLRRDFPERQ